MTKTIISLFFYLFILLYPKFVVADDCPNEDPPDQCDLTPPPSGFKIGKSGGGIGGNGGGGGPGCGPKPNGNGNGGGGGGDHSE